jgi:hypothetical protein
VLKLPRPARTTGLLRNEPQGQRGKINLAIAAGLVKKRAT